LRPTIFTADARPSTVSTVTEDHDVPAGWYADTRNRDRERYWTGYRWGNGDRWRRSRTPVFPGSTPQPALAAAGGAAAASSGLPAGLQGFAPWAIFIVVLAGLSALSAIVVGAVLISHTGQQCDAVCRTTHPRGGAGAAVMIGGLLEAAFIASFAVLHQEVHTLREQLTRLCDKLDVPDA
jgi:hypothetical protein